MYLLWLLFAMVLAALTTYCAWRTRRSGRLDRSDTAPTVPEPLMDIVSVSDAKEKQCRLVRWISIEEFLRVLKKSRDVIVFDLRDKAKSTPFPVPAALVLPVAPNELTEILECLPPDRSAVFYAVSNFCIFLITTSPCMGGSAPFYVLEGDLGFAEVA